MNGILSYLFRVLIALSQLLNTILGGRTDHTFSGRVGYEAKKGVKWAIYAEVIIDTIFWFDRKGIVGHCELSIELDEVNKPIYERFK